MKKDSLGFTLVELLIAITIGAMVVLVAVQAFRLGLYSSQKGSEKFDTRFRDYGKRSLIWKQIASIVPYPMEKNKMFFLGETDHTIFISPFSIIDHYGRGFFLVRYGIVADESGNTKALSLWETPLSEVANLVSIVKQRDIDPIPEGTRKFVIFDHASNIEIDYLKKANKPQKQLRWVKTWQGTTLPKALKITIRKTSAPVVILAPLLGIY